MSQATEAISKGPAPINDSKAVTVGRPKTTSKFKKLLVLSWLREAAQSIFSSMGVINVVVEMVVVDAEVTLTLLISATITDGLKVALYLKSGTNGFEVGWVLLGVVD